VIHEATILGYHTQRVVRGLRLGMVLFIVSEIMFFFSFFWAFFHSSLSPSIVLGAIWPPVGILILNPLTVPLINTFILLLSGFFVTISHYSLCLSTTDLLFNIKSPININNNIFTINSFSLSAWTLIITIILALQFTYLQGCEYNDALYSINDGIYGSVFYLTTGFHGVHVIIGTSFLIVMLIRLLLGHFTNMHHFGFEASIWYWHFVDVVWLFLFLFLYCWSAGYLYLI
jgi:cytochrome c oxidase subunit 3